MNLEVYLQLYDLLRQTLQCLEVKANQQQVNCMELKAALGDQPEMNLLILAKHIHQIAAKI